MARPIKKGLDYFPFDTDFFEDKAIKVLKGRYGTDGIIVYIYILCSIYDEGYYLKIDKDFEFVAASDLGMEFNKIGQIINFLCERSLFDDKLFTSDKVLTSRGIQLRFQEAVKSKGLKREIEVDRFWILKKNETQSYIKCTDFQSYSEKNGSYSEKNHSYSMKKPPKRKEIKEKESKTEESISTAASAYQNNIGAITPIIADRLRDWLNDVDISLIEYAIEQAVLNNKRNWQYINAIINSHFGSGRLTRAEAEAAKPKKKQTKSDIYDHDALEARAWAEINKEDVNE